jgi:uncharacterized protein (DUF1684 family)
MPGITDITFFRGVVGYGPASPHPVHVPDAAVTATGSINRGGYTDPVAGAVDLPEFELDEGKWFAVDGGTVVRFPADREWEWRTRRAVELVGSAAALPPEAQIGVLANAAALVGSDLHALVSRLREAAQAGEDLAATFKRVSRSSPVGGAAGRGPSAP